MSPGELQGAIDFLSRLEPAGIDWSLLPDRPDYAAVAQMARAGGRELDEDALREAFRVMMQARRIRTASR
jgi:hypothetical protein